MDNIDSLKALISIRGGHHSRESRKL